MIHFLYRHTELVLSLTASEMRFDLPAAILRWASGKCKSLISFVGLFEGFHGGEIKMRVTHTSGVQSDHYFCCFCCGLSDGPVCTPPRRWPLSADSWSAAGLHGFNNELLQRPLLTFGLDGKYRIIIVLWERSQRGSMKRERGSKINIMCCHVDSRLVALSEEKVTFLAVLKFLP